ncbi:DUF5067 domain-containing protein [Lactobacillus sp. DCY120]|uniref:DUF5067 domain-containing protein n=1 Tax=Bombilactobacillus apium TaxID=2675299 RepID=A0A850R5P3_9LACO|nr:DUF5067 domain-containing protein [Bombilactobacillus apium]NVY95932.1 DUF5067 domain-containing protein [Bombilactobacillus apium]
MYRIIKIGIVLLSSLSFMACGKQTSPNSTSSAPQTKNQITAKKGFKNHSFANAQGILVIKNINTMKSIETEERKTLKAVIFRGTFTNKSSSPITVEDFFQRYVAAFAMENDTNQRLVTDGLHFNTPYDQDIATAHDETKPGHTSTFAIAFQVSDLAA